MTGIVRNLLSGALLGALLLVVGPARADEGPGPDAVVRDTAQKVLDALNQRRDELRAQPEKIREIIDQYMLPVFDVEYAGRVVLGQAGRSATPEQRKRFVDAFYDSLVRTYGTGLLEFTSEKAAVDYALHVTDKGWMFYDVMIEGISYVTNYRKMVASEVAKKGLDGLIADLEQGKVPEEMKEGTKEAGS
jgi:phospholipid transport system substrate-binding protein